MSLFKYSPPERVDLLSSLTIKFSPIAEFNDPFESLPDTSVFDDSKLREEVQENVTSSLIVLDTLRSVFRKIPPQFTIPKARKLVGELMPAETEKAKSSMIPKVRKAVSIYRILSLSRNAPTSPTAVLLWAHYAASHTGIVFEFDENHPWVGEHVGEKSRSGFDAGDVAYSSTRPRFEFGRKDRDFYLVKSDAWRYEAEFRMVRRSGDESLDISRIDALAKWPPRLLKSVTIGSQANTATLDAVRSALNANPEFAEVVLLQADLHRDSYQLTAKEISR